MIIKCPDCGIEYSYGRNICHVCEKNTILFGSIFAPHQKSQSWNCFDSSYVRKNVIEQIGVEDKRDMRIDRKEILMKLRPSYSWNCFKSVEKVNEVDKKTVLAIIYE
jgi:hypothetical protein